MAGFPASGSYRFDAAARATLSRVKYLDRVLQNWRIREAAAFIRRGDAVLDIGSADGALFRLVPGLGPSVGIEPDLDVRHQAVSPSLDFYKGYFPEALPHPMQFDAITMLAVLEHIPPAQQLELAQACAAHLKPGGRLIITVPSQAVDYVLALLTAVHAIDGMSVHQHYGFRASETPAIFTPCGLHLITRRRFQLGFNNLFVFVRP